MLQKLILATNLFSRANLLKQLSVPFEELFCKIEEKDVEIDNEYSPYEWVKSISATKAMSVLDRVEGEAIILGADTVVTDFGRILHRPKNKQDAVAMLKKLQGRKHTTYTGLTVIYHHADGSYEMDSYVDGVDVYMHHLSDKLIDAYTDTDEPYDRPGGYSISGKGAVLIENIYGDYYTLAGLPLRLLNKSLLKHNIDIIDFWIKPQ